MTPSLTRKDLPRLAIVGLACVIVLGIYAGAARLGTAVFGNNDPTQAVYNRMIDGFLSGHLYLRRDVPEGFARLADPYDPAQNGPYRDPPYYLYDLSYYGGRIHAYFGAAPAVLLFLPYHLLTGRYLSYKAAAVLLATASFGFFAALLLDARRRYAPALPDWLAGASLAAFGIVSLLPTLLARVDVWEIPVAAIAALIPATLFCLWQAWHRPRARGRWVAAASLATGLALGSRPTALALVPVLGYFALDCLRREPSGGRRRVAWAAVLPLACCLAAIAGYNFGRFGNIFDSGHSYQLAGGQYESRIRFFSLGYFWDNVRIYLLHPAPWIRSFPFVGEAAAIPMSPGHSDAELTFGFLVNLPVVWCGLFALPSVGRRDGLGLLLRLVLLLALGEAGLFLLFFGANIRYEIELLFPLVLLAVLAPVAVEARGGGRAFRAAWAAPAVLSIAFSLGHALDRGIRARLDSYGWTMSHHQPAAALEHIDTVLWLEPGKASYHNDRGVALSVGGDIAGGRREFEAAVRLDPASSGARCNLGLALLDLGDPAGAVVQFRESLRLDPGNGGARTGLNLALQALSGANSHAAPVSH